MKYDSSTKLSILWRINSSHDSESRIVSLLENGPQSSIQLSNRIDVSQSTTKRILKKLVDDNIIHSTKVGRKVYYHTGSDLQKLHN